MANTLNFKPILNVHCYKLLGTSMRCVLASLGHCLGRVKFERQHLLGAEIWSERISYRVAKFHGDRPRELGDRAVKKGNISCKT